MRRTIILIFAPVQVLSQNFESGRGIIITARRIHICVCSYHTEILNRCKSFSDDKTFVRITMANEISRRVAKIPSQFLLRYILLNMQREIKFIAQISRLQIRIKIHAKLDSIIWRAAYVISSHITNSNILLTRITIRR